MANYLLSLTRDDGSQADVDVDLENINLKSAKGRKELADAVATALADVAEDEGDEDEIPDSPFGEADDGDDPDNVPCGDQDQFPATDELREHLLVETRHVLKCEDCGDDTTDDDTVDEADFLKQAAGRGWRVVNGEVRCNTCRTVTPLAELAKLRKWSLDDLAALFGIVWDELLPTEKSHEGIIRRAIVKGDDPEWIGEMLNKGE
jgi:hypothetical protein